MDIKTKFANLDILLTIIFTISLVVPAIVQAYGFDTLLVWAPTLCYVIWATIIGFITPNIRFMDSPELSTITKIRGWSYVVALPITLILNFLLLHFTSRQDEYFIGIALTFPIAMILRRAVFSFPRIFFNQEVIYMNDEQEKQMHGMLKETGSASIWASFSLLTINSAILASTNFLLSTIATLIGVVAMVIAYYRHRQSSKLVCQIAESLINSKWHKKYSARQKGRNREMIKSRTERTNQNREDYIWIYGLSGITEV